MSPYSRVVVWGEKLVNGSSHTHTYVHAAFMRAYQFIGKEVFWFSDEDDVTNFDFSGSLFITEGHKNVKIPIRKDCWYVLHHVDFTRFVDIAEKCLNLKAFSSSNFSIADFEHRISNTEFYTQRFSESGCESPLLLMPWATHLLPFEFERCTNHTLNGRTTRKVYWVGSVTDGKMGNINEITATAKALETIGVSFLQAKVAEGWESKFAIQSSWIAPAIVGNWQREVSYLPCRAFKNASYGRIPVTNSQAVCGLFEGIPPVISHEDYVSAFILCKEMESKTTAGSYVQQIVKENHTFLNRIETIETALGWR
jgi:hypothetical protein